MRKIMAHPESRPKEQSQNPQIGSDSITTTNADVSNLTDCSTKRGKSTSNTRPSISLKMPRQSLDVQLLDKVVDANAQLSRRDSITISKDVQNSTRSAVAKVPMKKIKSSS